MAARGKNIRGRTSYLKVWTVFSEHFSQYVRCTMPSQFLRHLVFILVLVVVGFSIIRAGAMYPVAKFIHKSC